MKHFILNLRYLTRNETIYGHCIVTEEQKQIIESNFNKKIYLGYEGDDADSDDWREISECVKPFKEISEAEHQTLINLDLDKGGHFKYRSSLQEFLEPEEFDDEDEDDY